MYAWYFLTNISAMVYPLFLSPVTIFGGRKVAWNIAFLLFGTGEPHLLLLSLSLSWNHSNFFLYSLLVWNCFLYSSDETETSGLSFLCPTLNVQHPQMETSPIGKLTMIPPSSAGPAIVKTPFSIEIPHQCENDTNARLDSPFMWSPGILLMWAKASSVAVISFARRFFSLRSYSYSS